VVVAERSRRVDIVWGFLSVVFALALVRGSLGTASTVFVVLFGVLTITCIGAWIWFRRHPARIEITQDTVSFKHRGQPKATTLVGPGELYVYQTHIGAKNRLQFLKVTGSEEGIPLTMFDHEDLKSACRANGWTFAGDAT
jgi:hypothetical protein